MTLPNLLHPVPITIQQRDIAVTKYDDDFREPIQKVSRTISKIIPGQVKWGIEDSLNLTKGGIQEKSNGYILFRYVDLAASKVVLQLGDRFANIGGLIVDLYITGFQPIGHYPSAGGPTLLKVFFADRQPSKQGHGF